MTDFNLEIDHPRTTAGEMIGVSRSEDAERTNVEVAVWHLPEDVANRSVLRMSPREARRLAVDLIEVAEALDDERRG
ncbi:hypothetical protein GS473_04475 [Rhodococcus hoagii]|nr:hypothetical protein [Prescottella equi]